MTSIKKKITAAYIICFSLIAIYILSRIFFITTVTVSGPSMEPTYTTGNILLCKRLYDKSSLKIGDIVVFKNDGKLLIKRIAAIPGTAAVQADGQVISEVMDEGKYYVLGDNYTNSKDSRSFGAIDGNDIKYFGLDIEIHPALWYGGMAVIASAMLLTVTLLEKKKKEIERNQETEKTWQ